jgi:hypothetical protein
MNDPSLVIPEKAPSSDRYVSARLVARVVVSITLHLSLFLVVWAVLTLGDSARTPAEIINTHMDTASQMYLSLSFAREVADTS